MDEEKEEELGIELQLIYIFRAISNSQISLRPQ